MVRYRKRNLNFSFHKQYLSRILYFESSFPSFCMEVGKTLSRLLFCIHHNLQCMPFKQQRDRLEAVFLPLVTLNRRYWKYDIWFKRLSLTVFFLYAIWHMTLVVGSPAKLFNVQPERARHLHFQMHHHEGNISKFQGCKAYVWTVLGPAYCASNI